MPDCSTAVTTETDGKASPLTLSSSALMLQIPASFLFINFITVSLISRDGELSSMAASTPVICDPTVDNCPLGRSAVYSYTKYSVQLAICHPNTHEATFCCSNSAHLKGSLGAEFPQISESKSKDNCVPMALKVLSKASNRHHLSLRRAVVLRDKALYWLRFSAHLAARLCSTLSSASPQTKRPFRRVFFILAACSLNSLTLQGTLEIFKVLKSAKYINQSEAVTV